MGIRGSTLIATRATFSNDGLFVPDRAGARERTRRGPSARRYWQTDALLPENFTLTLNAAAIPADRLVECALPLLAGRGSADAAAVPPASGGQPEAQTTAS